MLASSRHPATVFVAVSLLLSSTARAAPARQAHAIDSAIHYAGWAMDAYPGDTTQYLRAEMQRQLKAGANVVWIGHNNPGEVGYGKREPGLSYAVWAAYRDPNAARHAEAVAMVQAQQHALDAARSLGLKVVFPIGYQIQMGRAWNLAHPQDARRLADGSIYNGPDATDIGASFDAPDYRRDITAYYRWVDAAFVRPYSDTIMMLNMADEPKDGDYSVWADTVFRGTHGYGLHEAGNDPVKQQAVGRFEANYVADYAAWSARQWLAIDPAIKVTMSFCGGYGRYLHEGPDLEAIFSAAPANFVVTFDAYPKDGLYDTPLRESDLIELFNLIRTLGYYSATYHRPLWLWSTANSWGLNAASPDPGNIADAVANGIYLAQLARQAGGDLQGIAVWNYNIKGQGLYNDTHHLTYRPDQMFARVSASFGLLRSIMTAPAGQVDTAILAPSAPTLRHAGARLAMRASDPYHWEALAAPARANVDAAIVTHLDPSMGSALRTAIVLSRTPADLAPADSAALVDLLARDGTVIASGPVAQTLAGAGAPSAVVAAGGTPRAVVRRLATTAGRLLAVDGAVVEDLYADASAIRAAPVWQQTLHRTGVSSGYIVAFGGITLLYTIAPGGSPMTLNTAAATLVMYDTHGVSVRTAHLAGSQRILLPRRSYALVRVA